LKYSVLKIALTTSMLSASCLASSLLFASTPTYSNTPEKTQPTPATNQVSPNNTSNNQPSTDGLKPYYAKYAAYYDGDKVGYAERRFKLDAQNNCFVSMNTFASKFFYSDERKESSHFICQALGAEDNSYTKPLRYEYQVERTFGDSGSRQEFNWTEKKEHGHNEDGSWTLDLEDNTQDRISVYWQLAHDLSKDRVDYHYQVSEKGKIRSYDFALEGEEVLKLPMGSYRTYRVSRSRSNNKRKTVLWFAPELANAPVRIQQFKYDEEIANLIISEFHWQPINAPEETTETTKLIKEGNRTRSNQN